MVAHAGNQSSSPTIIINEIEVNAISDDEPAWIELLNIGDIPISSSMLNLTIITGDKDSANTTRVSLKPDNGNSAVTIPAHDHHVFSLPVNLDLSNLISLQLFEERVLLDEVQGLTDNIADERTWQRYPDGLDTGRFENWVFADPTKGEDNGNVGKAIAECYLNPLCMTLDVPMHKSHGINVNGSAFTIDTFSTSPVAELHLDQEEKKLVVKLSSSNRDSRLSFVHLTFPKTLLNGEFMVSADQSESQERFFTLANDTHSRLIIEYEPGDRTIEIVGTKVVPEFSGTLILLATAAITFALILGAKRFIATKSQPASP